MTEKNLEPTDLLGLKPLGEAALKAVDGAGAFLGRICLPAAEELGFLLRDRVRYWRASNVLKMTVRAQEMYSEVFGEENVHAHPRLAMQALEQASWTDDEDLQAMWAGLLVSSCSADGRDDSNLMFIDLLAKITAPQARILDHVCAACEKRCARTGLVLGSPLFLSLDEIKRVMRLDDIHRMDREPDHLHALGLLEQGSGFYFESPAGAPVRFTPSGLALQMHARVHGAPNPMVYFNLTPDHNTEVQAMQEEP